MSIPLDVAPEPAVTSNPTALIVIGVVVAALAVFAIVYVLGHRKK